MRDSRRTRIVLAVLLLVSLTLIAMGLRGPDAGPLAGISRTAAGALGAMENAVSGVVAPVRNALGSLTSGSDKDARIAALEAEVQRLRDSGAGADAQRRLADLDSLMRLAGAGQYRIVPAQVIAVGPAQGFAWTVTIDAGARDKLTPDMTVVSGAGLVGRVVSVSDTTSTVVLVVDSTTSVGARLEGSGKIGFLFGTGSPTTLTFQLLDPFAPMNPGDRLVTYGSQGGKPYVAGVPIGEVLSVRGTPGETTRLATVRPFIDVTSLDIVGVVVQPPRTNPRDSVLPPRPTTSASPGAVPGASGSASPGASGTATGTAGASGNGQGGSASPSTTRSPSDGAAPAPS